MDVRLQKLIQVINAKRKYYIDEMYNKKCYTRLCISNDFKIVSQTSSNIDFTKFYSNDMKYISNRIDITKNVEIQNLELIYKECKNKIKQYNIQKDFE